MENNQTIEVILSQINDTSIRTVAEHALLSARKALDMTEHTRVKYVTDEIDKIMPRALKARKKDETA
ncbi:MAG: hypothetical protein GY870_15490 [archaeon]|nr:hypothetical protein [archaeon]